MAGKNRHTLIIAGERDMGAMLSVAMKEQSIRLFAVRDAGAALGAIRSGEASMMLVEVKEPNEKGLEVLRKAKSLDPHLPVIVITACDGYSGIVEAMKAGAYHCLAKPCDRQELIHVILKGLEEQKHRERLKEELAGHLPGDISLKEIMGPSDAVARLISEVKCVTGSDLSVLIIGESGSGKEVIARGHPSGGSAIQSPLRSGGLRGHSRDASGERTVRA